jgi:hypothetical protein
VPWKQWTENPAAKVLSFVVAAGLWFSVTNRIDFEDTVDIPVEYANRPEGLATIEPLPERVRAHVRGKGKFLRYTMRDAVCRVDLGGFQVGQNRITFSGEDVILPEGVQVSRIDVLEPRRATVEFDEALERDVAIVPALVGAPDPRYVQVGRTFVNPSRARVKGPRKLVEQITLVHTRPVDTAGRRNSLRRTVRLVQPDSPTVTVTPGEAEVTVTIEPIVVRRVGAVGLRPATELPRGLDAFFDPDRVTLEIEGSRSIVEAASRESLELSLEARGWQQGGRTLLRLKEIRGHEVVFAPAETFADSAGDRRDRGPGGPPAVRGEVIARLSLPPDVEILTVDPDRFLAYVGQAGTPGPAGRP